ncbi:MAG: hypothetical protein BWY85_00195 [Firmicutes bacterium ADurb.Bin506]|nr:MAG: hypothetical protein BWY85_00195 [Firmicutes bacterium ADurb.Bin506]
MLSPEAYVAARLGDTRVVTIVDASVDLAEEVSIPHKADIEDLLRAHPVKAAVWKRLRARALKILNRLRDELRELEGVKYIHYYKAHEETERHEWALFHGTEDDAERDEFGRRQQARARVARGEKSAALRWRRNFSDDLVRSYVHSDDEVLEKRAAIRKAQNHVELADVLCEAMEHRARCLSHLAALHRDLGRAG